MNTTNKNISREGILRTLLLALLLVTGIAVADDESVLQDALSAAIRGDYATALRLSRPLAETGNANAQVLLGKLYSEDRGVPQDYAEATRCYRMAAEQGNAEAQADLGFMYEMGHGVSQDWVSTGVKLHKSNGIAGDMEPALAGFFLRDR